MSIGILKAPMDKSLIQKQGVHEKVPSITIVEVGMMEIMRPVNPCSVMDWELPSLLLATTDGSMSLSNRGKKRNLVL